MVAQSVLILQITKSAAMMGVAGAVQLAPGLLAGPLAGRIVDAVPRRAVAAASQAALAAISFVTAGLAMLHRLDVTCLLVLAAASGVVAAIDAPAVALFGNELVPPEDLPSAIAFGSVVSDGGRMLGTAAAAVLVTAFGPAPAYLLNGASFLVVALVIPFLRNAAHVPSQTNAPAAPVRAMDGLRAFRDHGQLRALLVIAGVAGLFGAQYQITGAGLLTGPLHRPAQDFGELAMAMSIGATLGAMLAATLRRASVATVSVAVLAGGALQVLAGLTPSYAALLLTVAAAAALQTLSSVATSTLLQTLPAADLRGRVLAAWGSLSRGWMLCSPLLVSGLLAEVGVRMTLIVTGTAVMAALVALQWARAMAAVRKPARLATVGGI